MELVHKHRPETFRKVVGQEDAVALLEKLIDKKTPPHTILYTGPSGCGKTTLARATATLLGIVGPDLREINAADFGGIEMVREIRGKMQQFGMYGKKRGWILDECHRLTADAQHAFLKILEEPPNHCFFLLCTTEPQKLIEPLQQRCTKVKLSEVGHAHLTKLVKRVAKIERIELSKKVLTQLIASANGSPRNAIKLLDAVKDLDSDKKRLSCLTSSDLQALAFQIYQKLIQRRKWDEVRKLVEVVKEDYEGARRIILACANTTMLKGNGKSIAIAFEIAQAFRDNFFDTGKVGLTLACMEVAMAKV